ncbi:hypothetical protein ACRALDRAFT_2024229 [Sodiomyces alcalophilus JCM 7366]|uniref:uncharacterized protein n=1 Tax=Sodiomyces alcalophilus JCM 7366 TaxID=591952 RepID=UPI0039B54329
MEGWARYDHHGIAEYHATLEQVRRDLVASGHILDSQNRPSRRLEALLKSVPFFSNDDVPLLAEWTQPLSIQFHDFDTALDPPDETASILLHDLDDDSHASPDPHYLTEAALASFSRSVLNLKLELPLLKSDPGLDLRRFLAEFSVESRPSPLRTSILPCEPVDDHEDAGLQFPSSSHAFRRRLDDELRHEVLDYNEEHLVLVAESQCIDPTPIDMSSLVLDELDQHRDRPKALTPPLLPASDSPEPFVPSQADAYVPFLSDPSTLMDEDLEKVMGDALDDDQQLSGDVTVLLPSSPSEPGHIPLTDHHAKLSDLVLEPPVLSRTVGSPSTLDRSSLDICASIEDGLRSSPPGTQSVTNDVEASTTHEKQLLELMENTGEQIMREITQEHLDPLDGTARIPVPVLDFDMPDPDWKTHTATSKEMFFYLSQAHALHYNAKPCKRNFWLDKELRWIPFPPKAAIVNLEETIDDFSEGALQLDISNRSPSPFHADYLPSRPGLRFIHPDDVDEAIPEYERESTAELDGERNISAPFPPVIATPPSDDDLMTLVRKRQSDSRSWNEFSNRDVPSSHIRPSTFNASHMEPLFTNKDDPHATEKLLSSYISMRAPKKAKLTISKHFPTDAPRTRNQPRVSHSQIPKTETAPCRWPAPSPQSHPPVEPVRLIISTTTPRSLMSSLRNHLPGVELLDRVLFPESSRNLAPEKHNHKGVHISLLDSEADIVVSPSTGIIATTLLKVRQKPLPGSENVMSKIRKRIAKVAPLYERLIVLVSEDAQDETAGQLSEADASAYSDFVLFATSFKGTSVQTFYVPGGPRTLGAWAAWIACENTPPADVQKMLSAEETKWETFFRGCGMNVYAAQVLTRCLEERYGGEGLMMFLQMSKDEKVTALEGPVLGTELLGRVSERLHGHPQ